MKVATRICPTSGIILPEKVGATDWTDLYHTLKAAPMKSGRKGLGEGFQQLAGDYLAGHSDFSTTHRYGHNSKTAVGDQNLQPPYLLKCKRISGRGEWIRTTDLLVPNQAL